MSHQHQPNLPAQFSGGAAAAALQPPSGVSAFAGFASPSLSLADTTEQEFVVHVRHSRQNQSQQLLRSSGNINPNARIHQGVYSDASQSHMNLNPPALHTQQRAHMSQPPAQPQSQPQPQPSSPLSAASLQEPHSSNRMFGPPRLNHSRAVFPPSSFVASPRGGEGGPDRPTRMASHMPMGSGADSLSPSVHAHGRHRNQQSQRHYGDGGMVARTPPTARFHPHNPHRHAYHNLGDDDGNQNHNQSHNQQRNQRSHPRSQSVDGCNAPRDSLGNSYSAINGKGGAIDAGDFVRALEQKRQDESERRNESQSLSVRAPVAFMIPIDASLTSRKKPLNGPPIHVRRSMDRRREEIDDAIEARKRRLYAIRKEEQARQREQVRLRRKERDQQTARQRRMRM